MKTSEMTNEELANWLAIISGSADFRLPARYRDYLREAAARLRKQEENLDLPRRIKELSDMRKNRLTAILEMCKKEKWDVNECEIANYRLAHNNCLELIVNAAGG